MEEFTFQFNRSLSKNRGLVFRRLLEQAVCTSSVTKKDFLQSQNIEEEAEDGSLIVSFELSHYEDMIWLHLFILRTFSNSEIKYQYE